MTENQLYDLMRSYQRNGSTNLSSLHKALKVASAEMLPFHEEEKFLYIAIDGEYSKNIVTLIFLCNTFFMEWYIIPLNKRAYLHVYSKV